MQNQQLLGLGVYLKLDMLCVHVAEVAGIKLTSGLRSSMAALEQMSPYMLYLHTVAMPLYRTDCLLSCNCLASRQCIKTY